MRLDSLARNELTKAIAIALHGFEWHDQHLGECPSPAEYSAFEEAAKRRLHFDPLFLAKVKTMLSAIEFILYDPATIGERRKEQLELANHYAALFAGHLRVSKQQFVDDMLKCRYD